MKPPQTFQEAIDSVMEECRKLLIKKQKDYGYRNITDFGELGVLIRVNDKVNRLKNLREKKQKPKNESIDNSWQDILNYACIALMLRKGIFTLPSNE